MDDLLYLGIAIALFVVTATLLREPKPPRPGGPS